MKGCLRKLSAHKGSPLVGGGSKKKSKHPKSRESGEKKSYWKEARPCIPSDFSVYGKIMAGGVEKGGNYQKNQGFKGKSPPGRQLKGN